VSDALALAAVDPNRAIELGPPPEVIEDRPLVIDALREQPKHALTLGVTIAPPLPHQRWRFFLFWLLVKLATRIYGFEFEIYRTPKPWELGE